MGLISMTTDSEDPVMAKVIFLNKNGTTKTFTASEVKINQVDTRMFLEKKGGKTMPDRIEVSFIARLDHVDETAFWNEVDPFNKEFKAKKIKKTPTKEKVNDGRVVLSSGR